MTAPVILPSIQEMFPEHLLGISRPTPNPHSAHTLSQSQLVQRQQSRLPALKPYERPAPPPAPLSFPRLPPPPTFSSTSISSRAASGSFDVLQSHPGAKSLTHIASSQARAGTSESSQSRSPSPGISPSSASSSQQPSGEAQLPTPVELEPDSDDADGDAADAAAHAATRKHVCPTCQKRFNRPSSLRIHVNTHTGATPFRCPYRGCGRAFNVNSNMRRHLRNHYAAEPDGEQVLIPGSTSANTSPLVSPTSPTVSPHSRLPLAPQPRAYPPSRSTSASPSASASASASRSPSPSYTLVTVSAQTWSRGGSQGQSQSRGANPGSLSLASLAETALRSERLGARGR